MANVPNMAQNANETYTFDIPVGYFAPDITPKYLVIIQDQDDLTSTGTTVKLVVVLVELVVIVVRAATILVVFVVVVAVF